MHPKTYQEFERVCAVHGAGGSVLEIGATPHDTTLLCMNSLRGATAKIGVNLDGPWRHRDFEILRGDANALEFGDESFDVVLCNAVLEHDRYFWRSIAEIRRVTRPGGLVVIGTPGYTRFPADERMSRIKLRFMNVVWRLRFLDRVHWLLKSTPTVEIHDAPGDYYRFSPQAFLEVLFEGMDKVEVNTIMFPPIIVGSGLKPRSKT
ncbi:MAG: class I SAM-dependent methyltransferase [Thermoanaerobaculia bacterium]